MKILITFLLLATFADADISTNEVSGKMAAGHPVSSSVTIDYFKKLQKKRKLDKEESYIMALAQTARDVFGVKEFEVYGGGSTDQSRAQSVGEGTVGNSIQHSIQSRDWNQMLSNSDLELVKKHHERLKKALGENSYSAAWLSNQLGEKQKAQQILNLGFAKSYEDTMNLKEIWGNRPQSLQDGESFSKALETMSTEKENKSRAEKLRKMQTHISNLPNVQVMT